jgi:hypothetical protein
MLNPREFKAIFDVMCWLIPNIVWTSAETFFGHLWQPLRVVSVQTGQRNQKRPGYLTQTAQLPGSRLLMELLDGPCSPVDTLVCRDAYVLRQCERGFLRRSLPRDIVLRLEQAFVSGI